MSTWKNSWSGGYVRRLREEEDARKENRTPNQLKTYRYPPGGGPVNEVRSEVDHVAEEDAANAEYK